MPIEFPLRSLPSFTLSSTRERAIKALDCNYVNFADQRHVEAARDSITHMGVWDSFIDTYFRGGAKHEALTAIANKALCDSAAVWTERMKGGHSNDATAADRAESVVPCGPQDLDAANAILCDLLSPLGKQVLLSNPVKTVDGVRFEPNTGHELLDVTLRVSLGHELAAHHFAEAREPHLAATEFQRAAKKAEDAALFAVATRLYWLAEQQWRAAGSEHNAQRASHESQAVRSKIPPLTSGGGFYTHVHVAGNSFPV